MFVFLINCCTKMDAFSALGDFWTDCLQSSHSVQTSKVVHVIIMGQFSKHALDEIQITVIYNRAILVAVTSECC